MLWAVSSEVLKEEVACVHACMHVHMCVRTLYERNCHLYKSFVI